MSDERDESDEPGLTPGDPLGSGALGGDPAPPPEPPPLPDAPLGPPSMNDPVPEEPPPPASPLPPPPQAPPPAAYPPPQQQPPPAAYPPPQQPPPAGYPPPQQPPAAYPPPQPHAPPGWTPPHAPGGQAMPPAYTPPPYAPRPARPRGPHNQPMWDTGVELSTWWARVGAACLDFVIAWLPWIVVGGGLLAGSTTGTDIAGGIIFGAGMLFAYFFYAPAFMARQGERNGQTLGKQIVGIRVIRDDGSAYGFGAAFVRQALVIRLLFGVVGGLFFGIAQLLDYLWPLWDETNRCLHDMIVNSHVVRAEPPPTSTGLAG